MTMLRVYDPAECDEQGVPLGWGRCRGLDELDGGMGSLHEALRQRDENCPSCGGHGSLKAAALWAARLRARKDIMDTSEVCRCEGCGHPMGEGTWDEPANAETRDDEAEFREGVLLNVEHELRAGRTGDGGLYVHYSPCDHGCRHGGPGRVLARGGAYEASVTSAAREAATHGFVASWRQVDVRTLGWPHDLRPEKLAVLCLRCWAER